MTYRTLPSLEAHGVLDLTTPLPHSPWSDLVSWSEAPSITINGWAARAVIALLSLAGGGGPGPEAAQLPVTSALHSVTTEALYQVPALLQRYGHRAYGDANPQDLAVIASYSTPRAQRFERLKPPAALALFKLIDAARRDGVWIVPVSGFRDQERQAMLFQRRLEQTGTATAAAKTVAPPGYSEHHTGYAVDLADGLARAQDISPRFETTQAFRWLQRHGREYGFELSFPPNNPQGIAYEPWHWRFIGSAEAAYLFRQQRAKPSQ
ncbi:Putative carboxypeptidase YodJ [Halomicronema hongdechloris C2206]|uniref:Carboxypeptidase YodJ n=1 Tax=Halomicronema hongdechloris C2206 TaxID=1641165 RepID=A0A1Z3HI61_9CYAN|nr:M15 family metallopeptidase [Halomicronema hongdechloris]ASC69970.1 Putative carboxypeptidase YodJ [Halomicronema hongdechloris C2206]